MRILPWILAVTFATAVRAVEPGLFDYDKTAPLDVREVGAETRACEVGQGNRCCRCPGDRQGTIL